MPSAKTLEILQLKLTLCDVEPTVWRRVLVPESYSLNRLHRVIQAVMLWLDYHLHEFAVGGKQYADLQIEGPDAYGERLYSDRNLRLRDIAARGIDRFSYAYDFGDGWCMDVEIEKTLPADPDVAYPLLVAGARSAPPEDCGGPFGYMLFVAALADKKHPDHKEKAEWWGWRIRSGGYAGREDRGGAGPGPGRAPRGVDTGRRPTPLTPR